MLTNRILIGTSLAVACSLAHADLLVESTFDSGAEAWTTLNGAKDMAFIASGGHPGGFVTATDDVYGTTLWLWSAPAAYLGDLGLAYGGTVSYVVRTSNATSGGQSAPDVKIKGNGITLAADAGPNPGTGWTAYSLALAPGVWRLDDLSGALATAADIHSALSSVSAFYIRGDYAPLIRGASSGLDSVVIASPVPEPGTWALGLLGLLGVAGAASRRHR